MEGIKKEIDLFKTLPAACLKPGRESERMWAREGETEGAGGGRGVKTCDTRGEGERVSHWKMQRKGEGTRWAKEEKKTVERGTERSIKGITEGLN